MHCCHGNKKAAMLKKEVISYTFHTVFKRYTLTDCTRSSDMSPSPLPPAKWLHLAKNHCFLVPCHHYYPLPAIWKLFLSSTVAFLPFSPTGFHQIAQSVAQMKQRHGKKYLQHQQDLYHVFIDFKRAFDRVWHAALWATMKKYNISTNLIQVIKNLCNKATSAVLFNGSTGDWFRTTVGVRQGCLLSPTLFNIFLERIKTDA